MRRFFPFFTLVLVTLPSVACAPARPEPTPTPFKPANLLTPRPDLPAPTATPQVGLAKPGVPRPTPTSTPAPALRGTPVKSTEPLQGFLLDDQLNSPIIGSTFPYRVYLPPDYLRAPQRRYPVLYMLHGNGGNYTEWSDSFLPEQADRLFSAGALPPMIVVMPDDGETTYWANWDGGPRWGDYVTEDLVSTVDQRYRTLPNAASRAIGGLSMGGLGALNLAFQHPDVFGIVGGHSPSVRLEPDPTLWFLSSQSFLEYNPVWLAEHSPGIHALKIWLDAGDEDLWLPNIEAVREALVAQGMHPEWHVFPGPHEAEYWIEHVPDYMQFYGTALRT
jgi:enterochelin esterase-like enzyme